MQSSDPSTEAGESRTFAEGKRVKAFSSFAAKAAMRMTLANDEFIRFLLHAPAPKLVGLGQLSTHQQVSDNP